MEKPFPFAEQTPNQMMPHELDDAYEELHELPFTSYLHASGLRMIWRHSDVEAAFKAEEGSPFSGKNSLDPLGGYWPIISNPSTWGPFAQHLFPPPAKATANATGPLHVTVRSVLHDKVQGLAFGREARPEKREKLRELFDEAAHALGKTAIESSVLDVTELSSLYAALATCNAVGLDESLAPQVMRWSGAQSGLLGQTYSNKQEQAEAVRALGELFTAAKQLVRTRSRGPTDDLASHLLANDLSKREATAVIANCIAAGVHTVSGTIQRHMLRLTTDPAGLDEWQNAASENGAVKLSARAARVSPGLHAWKAMVRQATTLESGTELPAGPILLMFGAANQDPRVSNGNLLTYGAGEHRCPGRNLATLAIAVFFEQLYAQMSEPRLAEAPNLRAQKADLLFSGARVKLANL